jgi:hypothetical protein
LRYSLRTYIFFKKLIGFKLKNHLKVSMVVHVYNPHTWGAEAGGLKVSGQPGLHNETLSSKEKDRVTERKGGKEREREEEERRGEKRREEKKNYCHQLAPWPRRSDINSLDP